MSSRLMRGAEVAIEPVAWRRVSSTDMIGGDDTPCAAGVPVLQDAAPAAPDVDALVEAARREGFEAGQAASRQHSAEQMDGMRARLARSIEECANARARYRREAEQDVVGLSLAAARRILHRELTVAPEALLGLVKAALEKMEGREVSRVRVAIGDAALVRELLQKSGSGRFETIADPSLGPGSVLIESSRGTLDASVETQLSEIGRGFADLAGGAS
jgi:flagellar assembly protein FliH